MTDLYHPAQGQQDILVPADEALSFNTTISAIVAASDSCQWNFEFTDGKKTELKADRSLTKKAFDGSKIKKIVLWNYKSYSYLYGI